MAIQGLIPFLPFIGQTLMATAVGFAGGSMWKWSGENVMQTQLINQQKYDQLNFQYAELDYKERYLLQDIAELQWSIQNYEDEQERQDAYLELQEKQHELQYLKANRSYALDKSRLQFDINRDELNRRSSLLQTQLIGEYDIYRQELQSETSARITEAQLATDVGIYEAKMRQMELDANSFELNKAFQVNQEANALFGTPEPPEQVAYILRELYKIKSRNSERPTYYEQTLEFPESDPTDSEGDTFYFDPDDGEYPIPEMSYN